MSILYEVLLEDRLLRQVIADRQAQLGALPAQDERRTTLGRELAQLYYAQMCLIRFHQLRRKHSLYSAEQARQRGEKGST
jgi:hypothetical protein